jgi:exosortase
MGNVVGWLIPFVSLGLVYLKRRELAAAPRSVWWAGLAVVALALWLHWAGARAQQTRLSLLALILLIWSIPLFLCGWDVAKQLIFPCGLLIFCVPLNFLDAATFPMRGISARLAALLLNGIGVAVASTGSAIVSTPNPLYTIEGADAASGLSMLLLLLAIAALIGYFTRVGLIARAALFSCAVPAMMVSNAMRLLLVVMTAELAGADRALALQQSVSYGFILLVSVGLLFAARAALLRLNRGRAQA